MAKSVANELKRPVAVVQPNGKERLAVVGPCGSSGGTGNGDCHWLVARELLNEQRKPFIPSGINTKNTTTVVRTDAQELKDKVSLATCQGIFIQNDFFVSIGMETSSTMNRIRLVIFIAAVVFVRPVAHGRRTTTQFDAIEHLFVQFPS